MSPFAVTAEFVAQSVGQYSLQPSVRFPSGPVRFSPHAKATAFRPVVTHLFFSFILLVLLQFSFFLCTKLGLFLLFPFSFIFTSLITHFCFSVIKNECCSHLRQAGLTFSAHGPFGPCPSVYDTLCPSWRVLDQRL